jgi:hypothetical protein
MTAPGALVNVFSFQLVRPKAGALRCLFLDERGCLLRCAEVNGLASLMLIAQLLSRTSPEDTQPKLRLNG